MNRRASSQSIFRRIITPLLALLALEMILFAGVLYASGALPRLTQNEKDILSKQIVNRKDYLEHYLTGTVGDLDSLSESINRRTERMLEDGTLRLETMDMVAKESMPLFKAIANELVDAMRTKKVSGIFVILNTRDLSGDYAKGDFGKRTGIYIRDMDPAAAPSRRNEDLLLQCASTEFVQSYQITTDNGWKPMFDFTDRAEAEDYDFFYLPFQTAYEAKGEKTARDYAYWGRAPRIGTGTDAYNMTYTVPLILSDGTVYGVLGVELDTRYLRSLIPYGELSGDESASYLLAYSDPEIAERAGAGRRGLHPVVFNGREAITETTLEQMYVARESEGGYSFTSDGVRYYANLSEFRLYDNNAPFENTRWLLLGIIPEETLHSFSDLLVRRIVTAALIMMVAGLIGSFVISRRLSAPLQKLSADVARAQQRRTDVPELVATGIREIDGLTGAITSLSRDIAGAKKLEQKRIEHERDHDLLTGLLNRRAFYRDAGRIFASPQLLAHAALIMMDLDNLKDINDNYGHDWGDNYIYRAARSFEETAPDTALIARVSGDEFYVLLYGYPTPDLLHEDVEKIRTRLPFETFDLPDGKSIPVGASGGIARCPEDGKDVTQLMRLADFTMYQAKQAGKNRILYFDNEEYQKQGSVQHSIAELNELLSNYALASYHFQPIFDARTGAPFAYEALMRVSMKLLHNPGDVLTIARQENRLADIEQMTWTRTMECFSFLRENNVVEKDARVFLNSIANLSMPQDQLDALARKFSDIMPHVVIEITESETLTAQSLAAKRTIPGFSGEFALDDYGSGYNSEIMLLNLAPKYIKVDISIVRDVDSSIDRQQIISNIVAYAHERDMRVVAEGVETAAELQTLLSLGIDLLQGFFLAEPAAIPQTISAEAMKAITDFMHTQ